MRILVACERSGIVRDAFKARGHDAWSCDLAPAERAGQHHQCDVRDLMAQRWDMVIAHPTCTYLCNSGVRWLYGGKGTTRDPIRWAQMEAAAAFFRLMLDWPCDRVAVENPIMHKYALRLVGRFHDQIIQPHWFGDPESKATALWLKGLPNLRPTKRLKLPACGHWNNQTPSGQNKLAPSDDRAKLRSVTYPGIAAAMADQWGNAL